MKPKPKRKAPEAIDFTISNDDQDAKANDCPETDKHEHREEKE